MKNKAPAWGSNNKSKQSNTNNNQNSWAKNQNNTSSGNPWNKQGNSWSSGTGTGGGTGGGTGSSGGWNNSGSSWNSSAFGKTAWNSQQQSNFNSMQPKEPIVTPVCTIGLPIAPQSVFLELKTKDENAPRESWFAVNHISQMEIFNKYTIDEIRYYDYLHKEFILKVEPGYTQNNTLYNNANKTNAPLTMNTNQEIIQKNITPWKRKPEEIKEPQATTQKQPFGTLPPTAINVSQTEGDDTLPKQETVPEDPGFRKNKSLYQHILTTNPAKSATPGLRQLNPQKLQNISKDPLKPTKSGNLRSPSESFKNHLVGNNEKRYEKDDSMNYTYIPDLDSIKNDEEVYNFTVIHPIYGSIVFPDGFNVMKINPRKNIRITDRKIEVDLSNIDKRNLGLDKNFISIVTLKNVYPNDNKKHESIREYEADLMKFCNDHNLGFISYSNEDGALMFTVPSLSVFPIELL